MPNGFEALPVTLSDASRNQPGNSPLPAADRQPSRPLASRPTPLPSLNVIEPWKVRAGAAACTSLALVRSLPSALTSLSVHLSIAILLASLATQVSPLRDSPIVLRIQPDAERNTAEVLTTVAMAPRHPNKSTTTDSGEAPKKEPLRLEEISIEAVASPGRSPKKRSPPHTELVGAVAAEEENRAETPRATPSPRVEEPEPPPAPATPKKARPTPDDDLIVERFIRYDIGKLRGAAGQRAKNAFDRLGPTAIPALVRGLNQSARIRASCPVAVISRKLQTALRQSNDRMMIEYAISNLGRGIPARAPHAKRIKTLRNRLQREYEDRAFSAQLAKLRPFPNESRNRWFQRVKVLYRAPVSDLEESLRAENPAVRSAAWAALSIRDQPEMTPASAIRLAKTLLSQWPNHTPPFRERIHNALVKLAKTVAPSRPPPRFHSGYSRRVGQDWQRWWSDYVRARA